MCRFVAYIGEEALLIANLLVNPKNSLVKQSKSAHNDQHRVNADGFGMAWYNFKVNNEPAIFKSIQPAWNDSNLISLSKTIESKCFMGHIRASTIGDVSNRNCHPFFYKEYTMVHNGTIDNFNKIRRSLMEQLSDEFFLSIKGNTDSECLFFLIMEYVHSGSGMPLAEAIKKAFEWINNAQDEADSSRLNIVITNGKEMIATRFSSKDSKILSLSYLKRNDKSFIIASEPLDDHVNEWCELPVNHYLSIKNNVNNIEVSPF
ncbi:MAG: class II glutamine amidotransferase [Rickettsiales bacterium]